MLSLKHSFNRHTLLYACSAVWIYLRGMNFVLVKGSRLAALMVEIFCAHAVSGKEFSPHTVPPLRLLGEISSRSEHNSLRTILQRLGRLLNVGVMWALAF